MTFLNRNTKTAYFTGFIFLLLVEISIALFVKDDFIRPYLGDFLVVILIYCFLMIVSKIPVMEALLMVLLFSFMVEFLQLVNLPKLLGFQPSWWFKIVLGSSFSAWDLLAYCFGILCTGMLEYYCNSAKTKTGK